MFILYERLYTTRTTEYETLSPCEEKHKQQNKTDRTISVYTAVKSRIARANTELSVSVALRHVIPLMDLMLR